MYVADNLVLDRVLDVVSLLVIFALVIDLLHVIAANSLDIWRETVWYL